MMSLAAAEGKLTSMCLSLAVHGGVTLIPFITVNEMNSYNMRNHVAAEVGAERAS